MIVYDVRKGESGNFYVVKTIDSFTADACCNFFPRTCCAKHKKHDRSEPDMFREEIRCAEMCLWSKTYCNDSVSNKFKFSSKGLNKRRFEDNADGPMAKYREVLDQTENVTSTHRGVRIENHCVAIYEQTKKRRSFLA